MFTLNILFLALSLVAHGAQDRCRKISINTPELVGECCVRVKNEEGLLQRVIAQEIRNPENNYLPPPRPTPQRIGGQNPPPPPPNYVPPGPPPKSNSPLPLLMSTTISRETKPDTLQNNRLTSTSTSATVPVASSTPRRKGDKTHGSEESSIVFPVDDITTPIVITENKIAIDVPANGCPGAQQRDPSGSCVTKF